MHIGKPECLLPASQAFHTIEKALLAAIVVSILVMACVVLFLPPEQVAILTSETGPFEMVAPWLWFVLAAMCIRNPGCDKRYAVGLASLCVIFGARELDLHRRISGESIFKMNAYRISDAPFIEKLAGGLVAVAILLLIGWLAASALRYFFRERPWRWVWGRLAILAAGLLVLAKIFDLTPRTLAEDFDITISWTFHYLLQIHEEWFESMVPVVFGLAVIFQRRMITPRS